MARVGNEFEDQSQLTRLHPLVYLVRLVLVTSKSYNGELGLDQACTQGEHDAICITCRGKGLMTTAIRRWILEVLTHPAGSRRLEWAC